MRKHETFSRDRRRSSPTIGCPSARTPRPGVIKTERDLERLQDHGEQALRDQNLEVCGDDDHVTDFWLSVYLHEEAVTARCKYDARQTVKMNVLKV